MISPFVRVCACVCVCVCVCVCTLCLLQFPFKVALSFLCSAEIVTAGGSRNHGRATVSAYTHCEDQHLENDAGECEG